MINAMVRPGKKYDQPDIDYKDNWLRKVEGSPRWYRHRYCPVKQEIVKNTLGTQCLEEAWRRLLSQVDAGEPTVPEILPDPRIIDVLELYLADPERAKSWKYRFSTLRVIFSAHLPHATISTFKIEAHRVLLTELSKKMGTGSIQSSMKLIRAATRWVCREDVFQPRLCPLDPPAIIVAVDDIRKITKGGPIRPRNQHPSREQMATFLRFIVERGHEDIRRFAVLVQ